jgi:DNA-binding GntR family transcriptional regulator
MEAAIRSGEIPIGSYLDNELDLAARFGLSRPTLRRAIAELVDNGLLVRRRGVGTRVVSDDIIRPVELTSLFDDLAAAGVQPTTRVIALTEETPTADLAEEFGSTAPLIRVERLRSTQAGPLTLMRNWIPASVPGVTAQALEEGGLYELLRSTGAEFHFARATIGARGATESEAELLKVAVGAACVTMRRAAYDAENRLIEVGDHLYRGDHYHFTTTIVAR